MPLGQCMENLNDGLKNKTNSYSSGVSLIPLTLLFQKSYSDILLYFPKFDHFSPEKF